MNRRSMLYASDLEGLSYDQRRNAWALGEYEDSDLQFEIDRRVAARARDDAERVREAKKVLGIEEQ